MTSAPFRCADAARARGDDPLGTAPMTAAYLLVEHPGPWRRDAPAGAGWSPQVAGALAGAVRARRGRLLLIRRHGRRPPAAHRAWAVVTVGGGTHWGTWREDTDLLEAAHALSAPTDRSGAAGGIGSAASDPILLVCTHGVHDACCAVRGRPVAAALARRWPELTWECSHVGGDRFAANLVVLPDGTYYGGLDADVAPDVVDAHLAQKVTVEHLRGSARWPPVAQVAVGEVHRRFGPFAAGEVAAADWSAAGPDRWQVLVAAPTGTGYEVDVATTPTPPAPLTCAAARATSAIAYTVTDVRPTSA